MLNNNRLANIAKYQLQCEALNKGYLQGCRLAIICVLSRGIAKLVKASDFDSDIRGFESFFPCQMFLVWSN
jgi:hypothetical protein